MNKLCALMLLIAVPSFAQQKVSLVPEPTAPALPQKALETDTEPWVPIAIAGGGLVLIAVVVSAVLVASMNSSSSMPRSTDFACNRGGKMCDGYINPPTQ